MLSGDPIPLVDVSVSLDGIAPLDVPIALERDAVYRLTAVALAAGQVDGFAPIASGRATLSVAFEAVPEPTTWVLWCTAAGAWLVGRRLAGSEERA